MEATVIALLNTLFANRVYWSTTPDNYTIGAPVALVQQVGGKSGRYVENDAKPDHKHARIMVTLWGKDKLVMGPLARTVEDTLVMSDLSAEPMGAAIDVYDASQKLFGSQQQFGFWYPDP